MKKFGKNLGNRADIAHVSSVHPWTDNRIHYREANSLVEAGYRVALIARESAIDAPSTGVEVTTVGVRSRLARMVITAPHAIYLALKTKARVLHIHDPELVWAVPLVRILRRKVVYDAHEDLPAQVLNKPYISKWSRPLFVFFAHLVVVVARSSTHIVAATESIALRFPAHKTTVVHNYPPLRTEEDRPGVREDTVVYVGGMSRIRGTAPLLESVHDSHFPLNWKLTIAGTAAADSRELVDQARNGPKLRFLGQIAPQAARELLLTSKVGVVPFQATTAHLESLPTKMFEYLAAGLPVIASDFPLWRAILVDNDCGVVVDESSPHEIARAIASYASDPELLMRHSQNARRLAVSTLNWANESGKLVTSYQGILGYNGSK